MARNWTEEQLSAIAERENTLLLSAAAGSGKTATLTERLIRMITDEDHPAHIAEMLIVTFTRAAAKELRERIGAALAAALEKDPENRRLTEEMLLLPTARIRTIDSFCQDLVRGHTDLLGIPAAFRVADEAEVALLSSHVMEELLEDAYRGLYAPQGLALPLCTECLVGAREEDSLAAVLLSLHSRLCGFREGVSLLEKDAGRRQKAAEEAFFSTPWGEEIAARTRLTADELLTAYRRALEEAREEEGAGSAFLLNYGETAEYDLAFLSALKEATGESYGKVRGLLLSYAPPAIGRKRGDTPGEAAGRLKVLRKETGDRIKKLSAGFYAWEEEALAAAFTQSAAVEQTLYLLLSEFARRFAEEKRRRSICDYDDLEHFALSLLLDEAGNRTPLAAEMAASFSAVCIDEYQDVNEIQHLIFEALSTESNRFMVGDIKQSIYGFRGAQPAIFEKLRRTFPTEAHRKVLYLTRNFRSLPPVIDFCNGVFDFLFGVYGDSVGYRPEDRLCAGRMPEEGPAATAAPLPVFTLLSDSEEEDREEAAEENESREAAFVAGQISRLLKEGKKQNGEPLCPADIAVLLRSGASRAGRYTAALQKAGVPVQTEDREGFFAQKEVLLAVCLLQTVNNPLRDIYLAGLLRSPLYGFSMEDLLRIRAAGPKDVPLFVALKSFTEQNGDFTKGRAFLSDLSLFREVAEGMPADRLIRFLYDRTALLQIAGEKERRNLFYLYDCAKRYEAASFHGLYRFLRYLNDLMRDGRELGDKRMIGEENGVSIITMHHSKGLEFPVCFLPECGAMLRPPRKVPLAFDPALGAGFLLRDESGLGALENPVNLAVRAAVAERETEEEVRVLYVAMTRAREQLYLVASAGRKKPESVLAAADFLRRNPAKTFLSSAYSFAEWVLAAPGVGPEFPPDMTKADETGCLTLPLCRFTLEKSGGAGEAAEKDAAGPSAGTAPAEGPAEENTVTSRQEEMRRMRALLHAHGPSPAEEEKTADAAPHAKQVPPENAASAGSPEKAEEAEEAEETQLVEEAAALLRARYAFVYPYKGATRLPGKLSVSRLYPTLLDEEEPSVLLPAGEEPWPEAVGKSDRQEKTAGAENGRTGGEESRQSLPGAAGAAEEKREENLSGRGLPEEAANPTVPVFLSGKEKDPAALAGTATHIFLQFCDFAALIPEIPGGVCSGDGDGGSRKKEAPGNVCSCAKGPESACRATGKTPTGAVGPAGADMETDNIFLPEEETAGCVWHDGQTAFTAEKETAGAVCNTEKNGAFPEKEGLSARAGATESKPCALSAEEHLPGCVCKNECTRGNVCKEENETPDGVCKQEGDLTSLVDKPACYKEKTTFSDSGEVPFSDEENKNARERVEQEATPEDTFARGRVQYAHTGGEVPPGEKTAPETAGVTAPGPVLFTENRRGTFLPGVTGATATGEAKEAGCAPEKEATLCRVKARVEAELGRLLAGRFITPQDAARVRQEELVSFALSPLASRIRGAARVLREFRFNVFLPAEQFTAREKETFRGERLFVQGVIDLLLFDRAGNILLADYKTDRIPPSLRGDRAAEDAFLIARHRRQLYYYACAVREIFGVFPAKILIYSLALGREIAVDDITEAEATAPENRTDVF